MKQDLLISCDIGLKGAFSIFEDSKLSMIIDMPTLKVVTKKAVVVFKDKNRNIVIKSGKNKGKRPTIIKTPEKSKKIIDWSKVIELFKSFRGGVYIDEPQFAKGSGKTIYGNQGVIHGIAMTTNFSITQVTPQKWQCYFGILRSDKGKSTDIARKLFKDQDFCRHDRAESALIGRWYLDNRL